MTPSTSDRELVDVTDMPKVELHVHLEGAIPLATRWEILQRHGGDPDVGSVEDLRARFSYVDFDHFIQSWLWQSRYLRTIEDFELAAERVAQAFVAQRIVYVEGFISPADVAPNGLSTADVVLAVRRGLDRVRGVEVALIVDLVRNYGPDRALRSAAEVAEVAA